jgi:succinate dehydrogenase / fumarate reductase membrane anchor subunit
MDLACLEVEVTTETLSVPQPTRFETYAWRWMRYSAFLLIPLVWIHSIIQALITGGNNLSLDYVGMRWSILGWRVYDVFLLAFAFSHGVNGIRQILLDFIKPLTVRKSLNWIMFGLWILLTGIGAAAIVGGVRTP